MLARSGLAWLALPFGNVCFPLCVGGHISRVGGYSFLWAIQTFSCGGSFARAFRECDPNVSVRRIEASFRERTFQSRHSLRLPLSLGLALVAMFTGTVGSPLGCKFRGMSFCAWPGLSGCPPFAGWSMLCWWLHCSSFHCRFWFLSYGLL